MMTYPSLPACHKHTRNEELFSLNPDIIINWRGNHEME